MKEELKKVIQSALKEIGISADDILLEHPADLSHGDYATNIALIYADEEGKKPRELADELAAQLRENKIKNVEKIEVAGPGFINFTLGPDFFRREVENILERGESYGRNTSLKGEKTIIEYTDPNPFKEFHVGHFMPNVIGESLSRIIEWNGGAVKRANYQGDVGMHVAKAVWGMKEIGDQMPGDGDSIDTKAGFLGRAYAFGAQANGESENAAEAIREVNIRLYKKTDEELNNLYNWGREVSLKYFETLYERLGTQFDYYFFESETGELGKEIVHHHVGDVFEESEGAYIFRGEKYGLHTRVFLNKDGLPTYEAKELGLAKMKYEKYAYDRSIVVAANEIDEYFKVLLKALSLIFPELAEKTEHISHGMMRLPEGKMSSRTGDVVPAREFLDELYGEVYKKMEKRDMSKEERHIIAERVSVAAVKYSILKQGIGRDIVFDKERALSLEGDSGPYLQYAYVRTRSIKAEAHNTALSADASKKESGAHDVERILSRFPEIVEDAQREKAPQYIAHYLTELASAFNSYYAHVRIIDPDDIESSYRLALTEAVGQVLKNGMYLLGFETPERM